MKSQSRLQEIDRRLDRIYASQSQKHKIKAEIKERFGGNCTYCGCIPRFLTLDHVIPQTQSRRTCVYTVALWERGTGSGSLLPEGEGLGMRGQSGETNPWSMEPPIIRGIIGTENPQTHTARTCVYTVALGRESKNSIPLLSREKGLGG